MMAQADADSFVHFDEITNLTSTFGLINIAAARAIRVLHCLARALCFPFFYCFPGFGGHALHVHTFLVLDIACLVGICSLWLRFKAQPTHTHISA